MPLNQPETGRPYTRDEYRTWCAAQPRGRYERVDGHIIAMAPERGAHLRIKALCTAHWTAPSPKPAYPARPSRTVPP
jgi:Uma2 family endonuclease